MLNCWVTSSPWGQDPTRVTCSCCSLNPNLASDCARQLSSPQAPVVLMAPVGLEVTRPPSRFRRRWLVYPRLVCTSRLDVRSDVATASRSASNVGKRCNVSATVAPKLNHLKGLNCQDANQALYVHVHGIFPWTILLSWPRKQELWQRPFLYPVAHKMSAP